MIRDIRRREFLKQTSFLGAGMAVAGSSAWAQSAPDANAKLRVAVIGCTNRGLDHINAWLGVANVEIAYICDVDSRALAKGVAAVSGKQTAAPKGVKDFRNILDDREVDAVSIAMPDHWHAPATILACAAGKHVYVEKPGSHNGREGEWMVAAARKHKRVVQMGNQRRSWPWVIEAIDALHAGELGKVVFARGWYTNHRASIGRARPSPVPDWLDYSLWEGPAPERPFQANALPYNWHWFWNWGTGELGNNGVHSLDLARWGLQVGLPRRVTCGGNRYHFQDDWETPDVMIASFDFGDKGVAWEGQSCDPRGFEGAGFGVTFYGEQGSMALAGSAKIFDLKDKLLREIKAEQPSLFSFDSIHFSNFADAIREGKPLRAEIEEGQKSTLLCHLGNLAWRTGHTVNYDPQVRKLVDDSVASALWEREYRPGWKPVV